MKRIAIFMDGTWQRLGQDNPTNVAKLAQSVAYKDKNGVTQVVFYNRGVGASGESLASAAGALAGGLMGAGLEDALLDAYVDLAWNYEPGDQIFIFGFSRGAFSARSLGGMIRKCGILKRNRAGNVSDAYGFYRNRKIKAEDEILRAFRRDSSILCETWEEGAAYKPPIDIEFMGVWDTVGQRGLPSTFGPLTELFNNKYAFHDLDLGSHVRSARHAVAVDEDRSAFPVTPWTNLDELNAAANHDADADDAPYQQRWFPGGHGEVGGGCDSDLPNLTLRWMADGAAARGLEFDESEKSWLGILSDSENLDPCAAFAPRSGGLISALKKPRALRKFKKKEPPTEGDIKRNLAPATILRWRSEKLDPAYRPKSLRALKDLLG